MVDVIQMELQDMRQLIPDIFRQTFEIIIYTLTSRLRRTNITSTQTQTQTRIFILALLLPFTIIFLSHLQISNLIFGNFIFYPLIPFQIFHLDYVNGRQRPSLNLLHLFPLIFYLLFLFIFSLLSTSTLIYTVATIHQNQAQQLAPQPPPSSNFNFFNQVWNNWNRLLLTFLCVFASFFSYNLLAAFAQLLIIWVLIVIYGPFMHVNINIIVIVKVIVVLFNFFYLGGLLYLSTIFQLSNVVSVLEESSGFKAMARSESLLKGKMVVATILAFLNILSLVVIEQAYLNMADVGAAHHGRGGFGFGLIGRAISGVICLLLLLIFFLWRLVLETLLYFVCKGNYHIDHSDNLALPPPDNQKSPSTSTWGSFPAIA